MPKTSKTKKILMTMVVIGVASGLVGMGTLAAFTSTVTNNGNTVTAGTVVLNNGTAFSPFTLAPLTPNGVEIGTGSIDLVSGSSTSNYNYVASATTTPSGGTAPDAHTLCDETSVTLRVTKQTGTGGTAANIYSGTIAGFNVAAQSKPASSLSATTGDVYKFYATMANGTAAHDNPLQGAGCTLNITWTATSL